MNKLKALGFAGFFSEVLDPDNYYTKFEIIELLSQVETPSYIEVDTLPAVGNPGVIYLIPKQGGGKEQWIYSNGQWIDIGGTDIDLSQYVKKDEVVDMMYPIGSTLIRTDNIDPGTLYTGTIWQKISEGRMLIGANSTYPIGTTGGEAEVTLNADQSGVKAHTHGAGTLSVPSGGSHQHHGWRRAIFASKTDGIEGFVSGNTDTGILANLTLPTTETTQKIGQHTHPSLNGSVAQNTATQATQAHNNMPPYLAVNIWVRTA